jgi:hypothetical protein
MITTIIIARIQPRDKFGPQPISCSSALVHQAASLGLGRDLLLHLGRFHSPFIAERPSRSNGCPSFPDEQNRGRLPPPNPSAFCLPRFSLSRRTEQPNTDSRRASPRWRRHWGEGNAAASAHRWVDVPPLSGFMVVLTGARASRRGWAATTWQGLSARGAQLLPTRRLRSMPTVVIMLRSKTCLLYPDSDVQDEGWSDTMVALAFPRTVTTTHGRR